LLGDPLTAFFIAGVLALARQFKIGNQRFPFLAGTNTSLRKDLFVIISLCLT
jgi:hypothetical protein